jgi:hypothetical protein
MTHIPVPYKKFSQYAHDLEFDQRGSHRTFHQADTSKDQGLDPNYDAHRVLVKMEDGTYVEKQDDNTSQPSRYSHVHRSKHRKTSSHLGSVLSPLAPESWQCSDFTDESSNHVSMIDLYGDPNALFLARILEDKLTTQYDRRKGKIPDMA